MIAGRRGRSFLAAALALLLGACAAGTPPPSPAPTPPPAAAAPAAPAAPPPAASPTPAAPAPPSPRQQLAAGHVNRARQLEGSGDLRQALDEWKIALTIDPADRAAQAGRRQLEARMDRSISERLGQGRDAIGKGDHLEARRHFLAVLAMDPANQAAFSALQNDVKEIRFVPHTVKAGETLATIAERYYGDRVRSEVIWETNQLPPNPRLSAGMVLKIPEIPGVPFVLPELRPKPPEPVARPDAPAPDTTRPSEVVEINPLLVGARESLEKGEYQVALADVDRVLAGNTQNPDAAELKKVILYGLGKSQLGQRKYEESVRTLLQLTRLAPGYQDSPTLLKQARERAAQQHYAQGLQLYREEKLEDAITQWKAVLEYEPEHANAKKNIEQAERLLKSLQQRQQPKKP
ncbi:MAG TPA: LysM peptidoglycan-binding domain-containing protein [Methylomirabilota bacterium]|nr:LysM peptidoglycan-binding domain-containing protein [Methylomirabilota bacterium]